jgi:predicted DNA binding CopG/RHH family protein
MKKEPREKFDRTKVERIGAVELPPSVHEEAVRQIADAECRVNFRWGSSQVEMVKKVADMMGVSYQQYIKQVVYRQVQADLEQFSKPRTGQQESY